MEEVNTKQQVHATWLGPRNVRFDNMVNLCKEHLINSNIQQYVCMNRELNNGEKEEWNKAYIEAMTQTLVDFPEKAEKILENNDANDFKKSTEVYKKNLINNTELISSSSSFTIFDQLELNNGENEELNKTYIEDTTQTLVDFPEKAEEILENNDAELIKSISFTKLDQLKFDIEPSYIEQLNNQVQNLFLRQSAIKILKNNKYKKDVLDSKIINIYSIKDIEEKLKDKEGKYQKLYSLMTSYINNNDYAFASNILKELIIFTGGDKNEEFTIARDMGTRFVNCSIPKIDNLCEKNIIVPSIVTTDDFTSIMIAGKENSTLLNVDEFIKDHKNFDKIQEEDFKELFNKLAKKDIKNTNKGFDAVTIELSHLQSAKEKENKDGDEEIPDFLKGKKRCKEILIKLSKSNLESYKKYQVILDKVNVYFDIIYSENFNKEAISIELINIDSSNPAREKSWLSKLPKPAVVKFKEELKKNTSKVTKEAPSRLQTNINIVNNEALKNNYFTVKNEKFVKRIKLKEAGDVIKYL